MASTLYLRDIASLLWSGSAVGNGFFTVKDSSRAVTTGADTYNGGGVGNRVLSSTVGTGAGTAFNTSTVAGATAGKQVNANAPAFFSAPLDADITISGTITFAFCGLESSMNANATFRALVYRLDAQGALTLIVDSALGTELGTALARSTWTASPTSTAMKKGDRLVVIPLIDDATATTMGSGFTTTLQLGGANASTADSNIQFTETIGFLTADPTGTDYYLRDTASDLSGEKVLSTTQGAGTATAVHSTAAGPIAFPGNQWTATAGGTAISWTSPALNAFTLGGILKCELGANAAKLEDTATPFDALTVELAVVDADGSNAVIWARSYTSGDQASTTTHEIYLSGADLSVAQGKRLRLRVYADDYWPNSQVSGTNRTIRYDGTSTYASKLTFTQTITEATLTKAPPPFAGALAMTPRFMTPRIRRI